MAHIPTDEEFLEKTKTNKQETFNKLLAVKKTLKKREEGTNRLQPPTITVDKIDTPNTNLVQKKPTPKESEQTTTASNKVKNTPDKSARKSPINELKNTSPFLMDKMTGKPTAEPSKNEGTQAVSAKERYQQIFSDYEEGSSLFLTDKIDFSKQQRARASTSPKQKQQQQAFDGYEEGSKFKTDKLQLTNKQTSVANKATYGNETKVGTPVRDSPYTEKAVPTDGKNLVPRSQEVHDILSYVPNWMVRWGNSLIFLILIGILVMSYFIKYPDVVKGVISINSAYPPVPLISKATGTVKLLKEDQEFVLPDDVIGIVKNTANYEDVQELKLELDHFKEKLDQGSNFSYYELPTGLQLGEIQSAYSNLFIKLKEKKVQYKSSTNDRTRKQNINKQIKELETIKKAKEKSLSIKYQEYLKSKTLLDTRHRVLYKKGSISAEQLNAKESQVRNLLDIYQNDRMTFNEIKKRILDLGSNKVEIDFRKEDKQVLSESSLLSAYQNLKNNMHNWEETYLLKAPIAGRLSLVQFAKNNMYLQQTQMLASIIPSLSETDTSSLIIGELLMPTIGAGKAHVGQTVNVALNDYPKKQYGILEGKVASIGNVSIMDKKGVSGYRVTVSFPKRLENTMNKKITFKHNMQGNAEIITADVRLLERFFHQLRDLFDAK